MRPRKKKNLDERLELVSSLLINKNENGKIILSEVFPGMPSESQVDLEIGCGKGSFAIAKTALHPERRYLAVEKISDVVIIALEKAVEEHKPNLRFLISDASVLPEILEAKSIDTLFINFCDPWPKARHHKRRLTHRSFLESYKKFLKPGGKIEFKTDNRDLFDFSVEEFKACGYKIENLTYDLHSSEFADENIMTEYEKNFSEKGFKINKLVARFE